MKFDLKFVESNQSFNPKFSEQSQTFDANFGSYVTLPVATTRVKIGEVTLLSSTWENVEDNLYSQVVSIDGVTENSQVDLTPNAEQLAIFYDKSLAFVAENEDGVVTVYAIGQKPENDYTMQVTITEVEV